MFVWSWVTDFCLKRRNRCVVGFFVLFKLQRMKTEKERVMIMFHDTEREKLFLEKQRDLLQDQLHATETNVSAIQRMVSQQAIIGKELMNQTSWNGLQSILNAQQVRKFM